MFFIAAAAFILLPHFVQAAPVHSSDFLAELRFRSSAESGYNMAAGSYFGLEPALFNDSSGVVVKLNSYADKPQAAIIWQGQGQKQVGVHLLPQGFIASGLSWLYKSPGRVFFEKISLGYFSKGLYSLSLSEGASESLYHDPQTSFLGPIAGLAAPAALLLRSLDSEGVQRLERFGLEDGFSREVLLSTQHFGGATQAKPSFIFYPAVSASGRWLAVKLRLGKDGSVSDDQPDMIVLKDLLNPQRAFPPIVDRDADRDSMFLGFDNQVAVNSKGDLLFIAQVGPGRQRALFLRHHKDLRIEKIAQDAQGPITRLSDFAPAMNDRSQLIFRATDRQGLEALWFWESGHLSKVLGRLDTVMSDKGEAQVGSPFDERNFFLSPQINNKGEILAPLYLRQGGVSLGTAFYVLSPVKRILQR